MRLHQIKIEFVGLQDRLLLCVSTDDGKEVLVYLTRRLVRALWPVLLDMARSSADVAMQGSAEARAALLGFQHEQAVSQDDRLRREPGLPSAGRIPLDDPAAQINILVTEIRQLNVLPIGLAGEHHPL